MTSKTSESELLEQVLSSSDSHSDSLELSMEVRGKRCREAEAVCKLVLHEDFIWRFTFYMRVLHEDLLPNDRNVSMYV